MGSSSSRDGLSHCHGYRVLAGGQEVGAVETPIFWGPLSEPEFLLIRTSDVISGTFRVMPVGLVVAVDPGARLLAIGLGSDGVAALPESMPMMRGVVAGAGAG
jgi:hypothetical protein